MIPRKPIRKVRSKPRPGRLKGRNLATLRQNCWDRDEGICQECGKPTLFGVSLDCSDAFHMAHIKAKRIGLDTLDNVRTLCGDCHRKEHSYGPSMEKPCPPKPQTGEAR